jgi:hypothetical protein
MIKKGGLAFSVPFQGSVTLFPLTPFFARRACCSLFAKGRVP